MLNPVRFGQLAQLPASGTRRLIVFRKRNGFETEIDVLRYPRLQSAGGHKASLGVVRGIIAVEAMRQCLLLHFRCELGNQQGVLETDVSGDEGVGCGFVSGPRALAV